MSRIKFEFSNRTTRDSRDTRDFSVLSRWKWNSTLSCTTLEITKNSRLPNSIRHTIQREEICSEWCGCSPSSEQLLKGWETKRPACPTFSAKLMTMLLEITTLSLSETEPNLPSRPLQTEKNLLRLFQEESTMLTTSLKSTRSSWKVLCRSTKLCGISTKKTISPNCPDMIVVCHIAYFILVRQKINHIFFKECLAGFRNLYARDFWTSTLSSGPHSRRLLWTYLPNDTVFSPENLVRLRFLADNFLLFW